MLLVDDRRVHQLDVQHRRIEVARGAIGLLDVDLAFEQAPVGPHVLAYRGAVGIARVDLRRLAQHRPMLRRPCAEAEHDGIAADVARLVRTFDTRPAVVS